MAKNTWADLDTTTANNQDVLGQSTLGAADANQLDAVDRSTLALMARGYGDWGGLGTVGGSANAITLTSLSTYQALESGLIVVIRAASANTGATTLNLDSLGAKAIRRQGDSALQAGDIAAAGRYLLEYDASYNAAAGAWVLMNPSIPANTYQPYDADLVAVAATGVAAFSGLIYGLTLSNNGSDATNDIDIAAGIAMDATNAKFMALGSALTKRLDAAWAVGTNQGGLDTGSIANTTYHMWLIMRSDTGVVDVLFSASATSPTMPANYDYKRRIGSIVRSGGAIRAFIQDGSRFKWSVIIADVNDSNPGTSVQTKTLSLPTGIQVTAEIEASVFNSFASANYPMLVTATDQADTDPGTSIGSGLWNAVAAASGGNGSIGTSLVYVRTNTSAQVRYRLGASNSNTQAIIKTIGWIDNRGAA